MTVLRAMRWPTMSMPPWPAPAYGQGPSTVTAGRVGVAFGGVGFGAGRRVGAAAVVAGVVAAGVVAAGAVAAGTGAAWSWPALSHPVSRMPAASPSTIEVRTGVEPSSR